MTLQKIPEQQSGDMAGTLGELLTIYRATVHGSLQLKLLG